MFLLENCWFQRKMHRKKISLGHGFCFYMHVQWCNCYIACERKKALVPLSLTLFSTRGCLKSAVWITKSEIFIEERWNFMTLNIFIRGSKNFWPVRQNGGFEALFKYIKNLFDHRWKWYKKCRLWYFWELKHFFIYIYKGLVKVLYTITFLRTFAKDSNMSRPIFWNWNNEVLGRKKKLRVLDGEKKSK